MVPMTMYVIVNINKQSAIGKKDQIRLAGRKFEFQKRIKAHE
jgi:hypothetical protein